MKPIYTLLDITDPLVLDTSVLINLHACKYGERILAAIPSQILVPEIVAGELEHETSRTNGEHGFLYSLVAIDQEGDEDIRLDVMFESMMDGSQLQIVLKGLEGGLDLGELDVELQ